MASGHFLERIYTRRKVEIFGAHKNRSGYWRYLMKNSNNVFQINRTTPHGEATVTEDEFRIHIRGAGN